jgi:hypothetical protein
MTINAGRGAMGELGRRAQGNGTLFFCIFYFGFWDGRRQRVALTTRAHPRDNARKSP